jgi:hypothetical protein
MQTLLFIPPWIPAFELATPTTSTSSNPLRSMLTLSAEIKTPCLLTTLWMLFVKEYDPGAVISKSAVAVS